MFSTNGIPSSSACGRWSRPKGEVGIAYIYQFALETVAQWNQRSEKEKPIDDEKNEGGETLKTDYMTSLVAKQRRSEGFEIDDAYYRVVSNSVAGRETTGRTIADALYDLVKTPRVLQELRRELDALGKGREGMVMAKDPQECHYLQAVLKEAMRLHPGAGLNLPRVVPTGGLTLAGQDFPEGVYICACAFFPTLILFSVLHLDHLSCRLHFKLQS